jgi:arginase family enzyme
LSDTYTFDAHRDYLYNEGLVTHASFFRYVPKVSGKTNYLLGYRDIISDEDAFSYFDYEINVASYDKFIMEHVQASSDIYLDLDIDVFDPHLIPCTGSIKDGGITIKQFNDFLCIVHPRNIKLISISEYIPLLETPTNEYANQIFDAIFPILFD